MRIFRPISTEITMLVMGLLYRHCYDSSHAVESYFERLDIFVAERTFSATSKIDGK